MKKKELFELRETQFSRASISAYSNGYASNVCAVSYYLGNGVTAGVLVESDPQNIYCQLEAATMAADIISLCRKNCKKLMNGTIQPETFAEKLCMLSEYRGAGYSRTYCESNNFSVMLADVHSPDIFYCISPDNIHNGDGSHALVVFDELTGDLNKVFCNEEGDDFHSPFGFIPIAHMKNLVLVTGTLFKDLIVYEDTDGGMYSIYGVLLALNDFDLGACLGARGHDISHIQWRTLPKPCSLHEELKRRAFYEMPESETEYETENPAKAEPDPEKAGEDNPGFGDEE